MAPATRLPDEVWARILRTGGWLPGGDRGDGAAAVAVRRVCRAFDRWRTGDHTWARLDGVAAWCATHRPGRRCAALDWRIDPSAAAVLADGAVRLPAWPGPLVALRIVVATGPGPATAVAAAAAMVAALRPAAAAGCLRRLALTLDVAADFAGDDIATAWVNAWAAGLTPPPSAPALDALTLVVAGCPLPVPAPRLLAGLSLRPAAWCTLVLPCMHGAVDPGIDFVPALWRPLLADLGAVIAHGGVRRLDVTLFDVPPAAAVAADLAALFAAGRARLASTHWTLAVVCDAAAVAAWSPPSRPGEPHRLVVLDAARLRVRHPAVGPHWWRVQ